MAESKHAKLLLKLGFEEWIPPEGAFEDYVPKKPMYIFFFEGQTNVIDETGKHWKASGHINMSKHGFVEIFQAVKKEQHVETMH